MNQFNRVVACLSLLATLGHSASLGVSAQQSSTVTHSFSDHNDAAIVLTESNFSGTMASITHNNEYNFMDPYAESLLSMNCNSVNSYIHKTYLSAATAKNPEIGYGTISADIAILRSGPGMAYKVLGQATKGESAYIISFHNQWFKVIYKDQIYYICGDDLQLKIFPYDIRISPKIESEPIEQRQGVASSGKDTRSKNEESSSKSKKKTSTSKEAPKKNVAALPENKKPATEVKDTVSESKETLSESTNPQSASKIIADAQKFVGTPYKWGGTGPDGFDCSGFIQYVYSKNGIKLPRTTTDQYQRGEAVKKSNLQPGDLVFLANTYRDGISHVGIYIGSGNVIHASSSKGITISSLSGSFFSEHYHGSRRVIS